MLRLLNRITLPRLARVQRFASRRESTEEDQVESIPDEDWVPPPPPPEPEYEPVEEETGIYVPPVHTEALLESSSPLSAVKLRKAHDTAARLIREKQYGQAEPLVSFLNSNN